MDATVVFEKNGISFFALNRTIHANDRNGIRREFENVVNTYTDNGNLLRWFGSGVVNCSVFIGSQSRAAYVRRPIVWD